MSAQVLRLYMGSVDGPLGAGTPIHGYAIKAKDGVVLVDTGVGGSTDALPYRFTIRAIRDALADHGLHPSDVTHLINTHVAQDHVGQNAVFKHAPVIIQRPELEWGRTKYPHILDCFDYAGARFELLDGEDAEVAPGIRCLFTPGHTPGHQSVLVAGPDSPTLIVGDAVYTATIWREPEWFDENPDALALQIKDSSYDTWRDSMDKLRKLSVRTIHFCHDSAIIAQRPVDPA